VADYGLFIGFGVGVRGREKKGLEVFNEGMQYFSRLQENGTIESWDAVFLEPHGGELNGFYLLKGDREKLSRLRVEKDFVRQTTRGQQIVEDIGVVGAVLGDGLTELITMYHQAIEELA
jgi:hypothetical protein